MKKYAIFVLSHERADTISTIDVLLRQGYTGDYYVVIDTTDTQTGLYKEKFKSHLIIFDKKDYIEKSDLGDLDDDIRIGVLARNFIQDEAKRLGYKYHIQLDDDVKSFLIRYKKNGVLKSHYINNIDYVIDKTINYLDNTNITALSYAQGAYLQGGANSNWNKGLIPKCMTIFIMRADDIQYFKMRMNDDITTSCLCNLRGKIFRTIMFIQTCVNETQIAKGGMSDIYIENGTYRKSFYTLMAMPSCTKITYIKFSQQGYSARIHHQIKYDKCTPKILSEKWKGTS